jgi:hypothetical protein
MRPSPAVLRSFRKPARMKNAIIILIIALLSGCSGGVWPSRSKVRATARRGTCFADILQTGSPVGRRYRPHSHPVSSHSARSIRAREAALLRHERQVPMNEAHGSGRVLGDCGARGFRSRQASALARPRFVCRSPSDLMVLMRYVGVRLICRRVERGVQQ